MTVIFPSETVGLLPVHPYSSLILTLPHPASSGSLELWDLLVGKSLPALQPVICSLSCLELAVVPWGLGQGLTNTCFSSLGGSIKSSYGKRTLKHKKLSLKWAPLIPIQFYIICLSPTRTNMVLIYFHFCSYHTSYPFLLWVNGGSGASLFWNPKICAKNNYFDFIFQTYLWCLWSYDALWLEIKWYDQCKFWHVKTQQISIETPQNTSLGLTLSERTPTEITVERMPNHI